MPFDIEKIMSMKEAEGQDQKAADITSQALQVIQLPLESLVNFPPELHKFKPASGQRLADLMETIRLDGIINALIVRPLSEDTYQIIAGHNRRRAAQELGYQTVPCIIRQLHDDEAIRLMISDNLHNRELLPSERGWAYRWEMEVSKRQGKRTDLTSTQPGWKMETAEILGKEKGDGKTKVRRYIRLTYLIPPLLDLVDDKKLGVTVGEQISYLSKRSQETVYGFCYAADPARPLKETQARALRAVEADPDRIIDEDVLEELMIPQKKVRFRTLKIQMAQLRDYFPVGTPEQVVIQTIQTALAVYFEEKGQDATP